VFPLFSKTPVVGDVHGLVLFTYSIAISSKLVGTFLNASCPLFSITSAGVLSSFHDLVH
jgi:hypothetical protein